MNQEKYCAVWGEHNQIGESQHMVDAVINAFNENVWEVLRIIKLLN